jgi:hypothetical protein
MPFRVKATWEFAAPQKGWTESLWLEPVTGTFGEATTIVSNTCVPRARLLGTECYIKAFRVQIVEDAGGAKVTRRGDNFQNIRFDGDGNEHAAEEDVCLELDFIDSTLTRHKTLFLGGIWDSIESNFGAYTPSPAWTNALTSWRSLMIASGFGWMARTPSAPFPITGYVVGADGFIEFTCTGVPFPGGASTVPQAVSISGVQAVGGKSNLNGTLVVVPSANNKCKTTKPRAALPYVTGGALKTFTYAFVKAAAISPEKIRTHERGAPLLESRGRARVRARV